MNEQAYRAAEDAYWRAYGVQERDEQVVDVPGMGTKVRVQQVGRGEPILFVHGGPNAGTTWAPVVAGLPDRRCIVIDRPGCGLSPPVDYGQASFQEIATTVLAQTLDGLGVGRAHVVASSLGGAWALWFAERQKDRVGNMVQMSCPAFLPEMDMKAAIFLRLLGLPVVGAMFTMLPSNDTSIDQTFRSMGHGETLDSGTLPAEFFSWAKSLMSDTDVMKNDRRAVQKGMTFRRMRPEVVISDDTIRSLENRVHWFWGAQDPFASVSAGERAASLMPNATLQVVENGGHLPWLDATDQAVKAVREVCARA